MDDFQTHKYFRNNLILFTKIEKFSFPHILPRLLQIFKILIPTICKEVIFGGGHHFVKIFHIISPEAYLDKLI